MRPVTSVTQDGLAAASAPWATMFNRFALRKERQSRWPSTEVTFSGPSGT